MRLRCRLRTLAALLALVGLQLGALPGIGVAVAAGEDGARTIVVCTGQGLQTIVIMPDGTSAPAKRQPASGGPGAWHDCLSCCLRMPASALLPGSVQPAAPVARVAPRPTPAPQRQPVRAPDYGCKARSPPSI